VLGRRLLREGVLVPAGAATSNAAGGAATTAAGEAPRR
jgi:hypothetical protein